LAREIRFERVARKAGGTIAVTIPPEIQRAVGMIEGDRLHLYVDDDGRIVIEKRKVEG
jgi:antitoxin component of MazEF toxin-antitoxin module